MKIVPDIRFKGFEEEWNQYLIKNVASRHDNLRIPIKESKRKKGNVPYYGANGIQDYVSGYTHNGEYVLVAEDGANDLNIYPVQYVNGKVWVNNHAHVLQAKCEYGTNKFLRFAISNLNIKPYLVGCGRLKLNSEVLMTLGIKLPKLDSQIIISNYLYSQDDNIINTSKKIASLKQLKSACLISMFPQQGETMPRVRFKGFDGEWKKKQIGEIGYTYSGLTGKTKSDFGIGDCLYITFLNVLNNAIINSSILEKVNVCIDEKQNKVCRGDILFNTSSETPEEVGMCAAVDEELIDVYLNSFCFGLRITDKEIDSLFFAYLMRSDIGRKIMKFLAQGATRYNLSKNNFYKTKLLLPETKAEQYQIASYFRQLDIQISEQEKRLEKLKQIKAACLDKMFV